MATPSRLWSPWSSCCSYIHASQRICPLTENQKFIMSMAMSQYVERKIPSGKEILALSASDARRRDMNSFDPSSQKNPTLLLSMELFITGSTG
jgi:hypothetical protein